MNRYRRLGLLGYGAAALQTFTWGALEGWPPRMAPLLSLSSALSFLVAVRLSYILFGVERIVFLEQLLCVMAGAVLAAKAAALPLGRCLDVAVLGVGTFLVFGRMGCASVGCCHGRPSRIGSIYGTHTAEGIHPLWAGVRLFPLPLVESALSAGLVALAFANGGQAWIYLLGYVALRFPLEVARGDLRPELWSASESQWLAPLIAWGVWLGTAQRIALVVASFLSLCLAVWIATTKQRRTLPWALGCAGHVLSLGRALERSNSCTPGESFETTQGILIARGAAHVSITRATAPLSDRHARVLTFWIQQALGIRVTEVTAKDTGFELRFQAREP